MSIEIGDENPLERLIEFYQAVERFVKYCSLCRKSEGDRKVMCSGCARESIDSAYMHFLTSYQLIFPASNMIKPLPSYEEMDSKELKEFFRRYMEAINEDAVKKYVEILNRIRSMCLSERCECDEEVKEIEELAENVRKAVEDFYTTDFLKSIKKQLERASEDPELFKALLPMPPKPLKDEYRI